MREQQSKASLDGVGLCCAVLSALFMGTVGVFAKKSGVDAETLTFFRLFLGALFMLFFLVASGKVRLIAPWPGFAVVASGLMLAGFIVLYIKSMEYTSMANAIMLLYLAPIAAAIYAHFFLAEPISRRSLGLMILALLGFAMMLEGRLNIANQPGILKGLIFAILAMGCYAAFMLINRVIEANIHVYARTFHQLLSGALAMLPLALLTNGNPISPNSWPWLIGAGFVPGFLAILCAVIALSRLPAATFGALAYFEPVAVIILAWVFFDQSLSFMQIGGAALIIGSGLAKIWSDWRYRASSADHDLFS